MGSLLAPDSHRLAYTGMFVVATNLPDIDFLTRPMKTLGSPKYYHNFTHSVLGIALLSSLAAGFTKFLLPVPNLAVLFAIYFLGCLVHVLLDVTITSCYVRLLWPFSNRQFSMGLLVGLNFRTASKKCGKPQYLRCTLCQLRAAMFNPVLLLFILGSLGACVIPSHRRSITLGFALCILLLLVGIHLWKRRLKRCTVERFRMVHPESLYLYPSDVIPFRWVAIEERERDYQVFALRGLRPEIRWAGTFPRPETLSHEAVRLSMGHPLFEIYRPRMAHPYAEVKEQNGKVLIVWKDLRYLQRPSVDLYAFRLEYNSELNLLSGEFREHWFPAR